MSVTTLTKLLVPALVAGMFLPAPVASAKALSASEVRKAMLGKTIKTRRFGLSIRMRYRPNGTVRVTSALGNLNGTWRARGNQFCTTFNSGPAKGTDCVSFTKIGPNRYRTSAGQRFSVSP
ncbi:MAG: hypothetical protein AAFO61_09760 [Pseudomonadota bacterium]